LRVVIWAARADFTTLDARDLTLALRKQTGPGFPPLRTGTQEANMVVDERSWHELYTRLEEVLGPEAATTLIEHLPPVGWSDVATNRDLVAMEARIDLRFEAFEHRLTGSFEHELRQQTMTTMFGMVGVVLTMAALAFALARLT
jgi:hypothetical protein